MEGIVILGRGCRDEIGSLAGVTWKGSDSDRGVEKVRGSFCPVVDSW